MPGTRSASTNRRCVINALARKLPIQPGLFTYDIINDVKTFFKTLPGYSPTPLHRLPIYARDLGVGELLVKDESQRLGLNTFKIVGSTYAIHRLHARGGLKKGSVLTCATDGNHGRAVARVAHQLQLPARVYMPADAAPARVRAIRSEGAEVTIIEGNYDDAVSQMADDATKNGWVLISDTAWLGYEAIPRAIMAGYTILMEEAASQWDSPPDMVVVQAGCGGFACAILSWFLSAFGASRPPIVSCEAKNAACLLESVRAGRRVKVAGTLTTIMAGLSCGVVSSLAWPTLHAALDACVSITDDQCREAVRRLGKPKAGDPVTIAGESGASGVAALTAIMKGKEMLALRERLALGPKSRVLVINTEGVTNPDSYHSIVG